VTSLKIPTTKLDPQDAFKDGAEILREELKFARFIIRMQQRFAAGIKKCFITHLKLKGVFFTRSDINTERGIFFTFNFFFFLRPNQLVSNSRGRIIESFSRTLTVPPSNLNNGDIFTIVVGYQTPNPTQYNLTAVTGAPGANEFLIGATPTDTANNLAAAIAALNPHASDGGLMGDEEEREIIPAVKEIRERGIDAEGPVPADAVFHQPSQ
jgi:hypothetical protein